jgi:hypothetical protein
MPKERTSPGGRGRDELKDKNFYKERLYDLKKKQTNYFNY